MMQLVVAIRHQPEGSEFDSVILFDSGLTEMSKGKVIPLQARCGPEVG